MSTFDGSVLGLYAQTYIRFRKKILICI